MKRRLAVAVLAAALAVTAMTGCSSELDGSEVVAEIGDTKITADVANFYARYQQAQYETYYTSYLGEDMWESEATEGSTYEESVKDSIMSNLQQMYVLDMHKDEFDVSLPEEDEAAIEQAASRFIENNTLDDKNLVSGDEDTVKRFLELLTIREKMAEAIGATVDTEVSDEEAAQKSMQYVYFSTTTTDEEGNSSQMTDEEKAALQEQVQAFRDGAVDAADFAAYAEEQGYTASTLTFDSESVDLDSNIIAAADELGEGEVSDVLEGSTGYYVVKLTSLLDREATDAEKTTIVEERRTQALADQTSLWLQEDEVTVHDNVWDKIDFVKTGVTIKDSSTDTSGEGTDASGESDTSGDTAE